MSEIPDATPTKFDSLDFSRLYLQLHPDTAGSHHLMSLQRQVRAAADQTVAFHGRIVPENQLHLTVIHFGKIADAYRSIAAWQSIDHRLYCRSLRAYAQRTEALKNDATFELKPTGLAGYGLRGRTLVVEYVATPELRRLHAASLAELRAFFESIGLDDIDDFMAMDENFKHCLSLRPHVTICKGYDGDLPRLVLEPLCAQIGPVRYV